MESVKAMTRTWRKQTLWSKHLFIAFNCSWTRAGLYFHLIRHCTTIWWIQSMQRAVCHESNLRGRWILMERLWSTHTNVFHISMCASYPRTPVLGNGRSREWDSKQRLKYLESDKWNWKKSRLVATTITKKREKTRLLILVLSM